MPWKSNPDKKETRECEVCGKEFTFYKCWPKKYCSGACYNKARANTVTAICPQCGKEFQYYHEPGRKYPRKYCSHACKGAAKTLPPEERAHITYNCEYCGKEVTKDNPASVRGRFCSLKCFGLWQRESRWQAGEKHPNWRGGYEPYYGPSWEAARKVVRERDNYTCQDCGMTEAELGKELDVHHLVRFGDFGRERHEEANQLDNLVSLCPVCHTCREWKQGRNSS